MSSGTGSSDRESPERARSRNRPPEYGDRALDRTEETLDESRDLRPVALPEGASRQSEATLLEVGAALSPTDSSLSVVQFDEVPDQQPLDYASGVQSPDDLEFECRTDTLAAALDTPSSTANSSATILSGPSPTLSTSVASMCCGGTRCVVRRLATG